MPEPGAQQPKQELNGTVLAANLLEQFTLLNVRLEQFLQVTAELHAMTDTLCGHFDVVHTAMDNLADLKHQGKQKLTLDDLVKCWVEAADEILPEDDESEEEEGDVPTRR